MLAPDEASPLLLSVEVSWRRLVSSESLPSFPPTVPCPDAALCSAGSLGSGSPASSLVSRHSDFSWSRRRSLLASLRRSGSRRGPRDLPSSWVTLVHVRRTKTPVEEHRPGPR